MINDHIHFGGGGDAVFRLEREAYERAGHEVYTFSQASAVSSDATERDFVCGVGNGRFAAKVGKFVGSPHVRRSLQKSLDSIQPDLVRVHLVSRYPAAIYPALAGYHVIQTLHGPNLFCATSWGNLRSDGTACEMGIGVKCWRRGCMPLYGMLLYDVLDSRVRPAVKRAVKLYHCPSHQILTRAESLGYSPTVHFPLGIDRGFALSQPAPHDGPPTILYVGALAEEKGLLFLPEALGLIKEQVPNVKLALCGRGPLEERLKHEFASRQLSASVDFKGFVDHSRMVDQYRSAHVFVLPSIWSEQFGLVGPEALACGVPCVASNVGGIPEWLQDGKWGYLVPPRDSHALAERVVRLLLDRDNRLRFGEAGRTYARAIHDPDIYQRRWLELAASCASRRRG